MNTSLFLFMEHISPLTDEIKSDLILHADRRTYAKHELLIEPGKINNHLFFIERGIVRVYYYEGRKEITDYFLKEGELLALAESYFDQQPSIDGVEALEETRVLSLDFGTLEKLYHKHKLLETNSRLTTMRYSFYWRKRYRQTKNKKVEERYQQLITTTPEILQRVHLHYIASYLDTSIAHLSRIRRDFDTTHKTKQILQRPVRSPKHNRQPLPQKLIPTAYRSHVESELVKQGITKTELKEAFDIFLLRSAQYPAATISQVIHFVLKWIRTTNA